MLNRLSVKMLLTSAVGLLAVAMMIMLAVGAWDSWTRLRIANRTVHVAEASDQLFTAMHNMRVDRSSSSRDLRGEAQNGLSQTLREVREAETPALKADLVTLREIDLPGGPNELAALEQLANKLFAMHQESAAALTQPKAPAAPISPRTS